jgi:3-methyl-2-oxobutanoate hydroxymethyltransferase
MESKSRWSAFPLRALQERRESGLPIAMISLYDAPSAALACDAGADVLLVGDSVGNVLLGYPGTVPVEMEDMRRHTGAVVRGVLSSSRPGVPVVADMPFASYHGSADATIAAGASLMRVGAAGLKVEGAGPRTLDAIALLSEMGAPIVGHIGFTPQSAGRFSRIVQGRDDEGAQAVVDQARRLEDAGVAAMVLEAVAPAAAARATQAVRIPTIGIGSGPDCSGQVLVWNDLTGQTPHPPPFAKAFAQARQILEAAAHDYVQAVHSKTFPSK